MLLPQVPIEEISGYINSCDVMLVPLRKDAIFASFIPSKMFDYMACAKVLVLTVDGEARGILEESGAGVYVEPEQPQALWDALIKLRGSPEVRTQMGQLGRAFVLKHYLRDVQADRLAEILSAHSRHPT